MDSELLREIQVAPTDPDDDEDDDQSSDNEDGNAENGDAEEEEELSEESDDEESDRVRLKCVKTGVNRQSDIQTDEQGNIR